jgi:membrane protease YdiL (CAAX protease family)
VLAIAALLGGLLVSVIAAGLTSAIAVGLGAPSGGPTATVAGFVGQDLALAAVAVGVTLALGRSVVSDLGLRRAAIARTLTATVVAGASFYTFLMVYSALVDTAGAQTTLDDLGTRAGAALLVAGALVTVTLAPVTEELFFRGLIFGSLRRSMPPLAAAMVISLVFGALHFTGGRSALVVGPLVVLGVVFCLLYQYTKTLFAPIALHAVNNAIAFSSGMGDATSIFLAGGLAVLVAVGCLAGVARPRYRVS